MTAEEIRYEQDLIRRCQADDQEAWFELFDRYTAWIWRAARRCLGAEGRNEDLVEEIVAQVWASLGYHHGQRLRTYDSKQVRFATFLAARTWQVVLDDRERRWGRRCHEVSWNPQQLQDLELLDAGLPVEASDWRVQEFLATLPQWEAVFFRQTFLDPDTPGDQPVISDTCFRKRLQRVRRKFEAFLNWLGCGANQRLE